MYLAHFQLAEKPFADGAEERFYYPSEGHQAALHKLRYALEDAGGSAVLIGPSGSGKSLLVAQLVRRLPETISPVVQCTFPQLGPADFLAWLARELDPESQASPTVEQSLRRIERKVAEHAAAGRRPLVVIDEAQLLDPCGTLETLRLLLGLGGRSPALSLLLVGQPALLPALARRPEVEERMALACALRPFSPAESAAYIAHRLRIAGARESIFHPASIDTIFEVAQGSPRRINRVCDLALLVAFAEERCEITSADIEAVCEELLLSAT